MLCLQKSVLIIRRLAQPRNQASSRAPSDQRRFGTEFPTSLTGDVTSEIAEDDWERGCVWPRPNTCCAALIFIEVFFLGFLPSNNPEEKLASLISGRQKMDRLMAFIRHRWYSRLSLVWLRRSLTTCPKIRLAGKSWEELANIDFSYIPV